jgi:lipoprotein-anchoring transpeptidase ErfK/SrfK
MQYLFDFQNFVPLLESTTSKVDTSLITSQRGMIAPDKIRSKLLEQKIIQDSDYLIVVRGSQQKLTVFGPKGKKLKEFPISTSAKGFGLAQNSGQTPIGIFQIGQKKSARLGEIFVGKNPIGKILGPNQDSTRTDEHGKTHTAEVITGFIDLHGLETRNRNTFSRAIYLHGTNRESKLGHPASGGCIRTPNSEILWLVKNIPDKAFVFIQPN